MKSHKEKKICILNIMLLFKIKNMLLEIREHSLITEFN